MSRQEQRTKHHSVYWYLLNRKKPFAYSTVATRDLIEVILEETHDLEEARRRINYDEDAKKILTAYIVFEKGRENSEKRRCFNKSN